MISQKNNRACSISVDFEDLHFYSKTLGLSHPEKENSAYDKAIDRFITLFDHLGIKGTFFLIGKDVLKSKDNRKAVCRLSEHGHEIANHTMTHPFNFSDYTYEQKRKEILEAGRLLEDIIGKKVTGFRAPCYDIDEEMIDILEDAGYLYDSSVFPCYYKLLQQFIYVFLCRGKWRKMGSFLTSFMPNRPYRLGRKLHHHNNGSRNMVEFPITMVPYIRFPFYSTILFSTGTPFFKLQYPLVKRLTTLTYELHSIDLADAEEDMLISYYPGIERHPCIRLNLNKKIQILSECFSVFKKDFGIETMESIAKRSLKI